MRISITNSQKELITLKELERLYKSLLVSGTKDSANNVYRTICMMKWLYDRDKEKNNE